MFISSRFSFITTVDFTSRPDMPTTSALLSSATSRMVAIGCLMPMLTTS
ncbi:PPE family protein [Mycobacterium tuberculosis]|uniref:PPE family protein n=1 Tax=Mycobacterium tuberculosis TaxID=1773 RepID=A0A655J735_MYCTX|nr:PPE family protein [Mycobacterium tuberculosis]CKV15361.1 PPE family protein [Mycobacterium tuberculosis]CNU40927.1 PPE family protein [Mycobacterium tuberculosis]COW52558.1 PPE family protein [Mycobacterium tuberculosis]COX07303.1 PPE family protein [Mycobacterium tuberculosis]